MAAQLIPVTNSPANYQMTVQLDGVAYILIFSYNDRSSTWGMLVQDASGNALTNVISMVPNYPLNYRSNKGQVQGMPPGLFYLVDELNLGRIPDDTNFGTDINLYYVPIADIQAGT